jgi:hypothetical protein
MDSTPIELGITKGTYIGPKYGWKPRTYYIVETASGPDNPVHKVLFYSGFLSKNKKGEQFPSGHNCILSPVYDQSPGIGRTYYMKVIEELNINLED